MALTRVSQMSVQRTLIAAIAVSVAMLAGCKSSGTKDAGDTMPPPAPDAGISTTGSGSAGVGDGSALNGGADISQHSVYFDLDSSNLKPEGQAVVANWAKYLSASPTAKVRLEGNTDERGTREYNVALGERRAQSVAQSLESSGVGPQQIDVVSYGKERPSCEGHDESCWSQNRRVDLVQQ
jgi:peptidoglycan-associated lipoprotein